MGFFSSTLGDRLLAYIKKSGLLVVTITINEERGASSEVN